MKLMKLPENNLPFKIKEYENTCIKIKEEIKGLVKVSEGLVFHKIGLDAGLGLIPVVGGLYTFIIGLWLFLQACRVRVNLQEKFFIIILVIIDVAIGIGITGIGEILDAFFRVHAWIGNRIIIHINSRLELIDDTRQKLAQSINVDLKSLEDVIFRDGKTQQEQLILYGSIVLILVLIFVGCQGM